MPAIDERLARNVRDVHGARGEQWLAALPVLLADCARRWTLRVEDPFADLSYSYVAPARRGEARVVLKLGVPHPEFRGEMAALEVFGGRGAVRLLEADPERGALLLERLEPGTPLSALDDDAQATAIVARAMRALWGEPPVTHTFRSLDDWARGFERLRARHGGTSGPLPAPLVAQAEATFAASSARAAKLLHGDLHHANVLAAGAGAWRAIDPKGVVGDPAFEVGPWLLNPAGLAARPDLREVLARRLDVLGRELSLDRDRLRRAGLAFAMLSACWSLEDHGGGFEPALAIARVLDAETGP
jgi:streptomycin 6-kinase